MGSRDEYWTREIDDTHIVTVHVRLDEDGNAVVDHRLFERFMNNAGYHCVGQS